MSCWVRYRGLPRAYDLVAADFVARCANIPNRADITGCANAAVSIDTADYINHKGVADFKVEEYKGKYKLVVDKFIPMEDKSVFSDGPPPQTDAGLPF